MIISCTVIINNKIKIYNKGIQFKLDKTRSQYYISYQQIGCIKNCDYLFLLKGYRHIAIKLSLCKVNFGRDCFFFLRGECR
ncbi:hypothetical protein CN617_17640 [Bacillus wiedmannii]|nr:hypothetical protein CN617_17640 [Bacillus wiedmannii]